MADIPAFLQRKSNLGAAWYKLLDQNAPAINPQTEELVGPWAQCLLSAVYFEHTNDWSKLPGYEEQGPAGQVIDYLQVKGYAGEFSGKFEDVESKAHENFENGVPAGEASEKFEMAYEGTTCVSVFGPVCLLMPCRYVRRSCKDCLLTDAEKETLQVARDLWEDVNVDNNACDCYPILGRSEAMLVQKVLEDESRESLSKYRKMCQYFGENLRHATAEEGGQSGKDITEEEFEDALLSAAQKYVHGMVTAVREEVSDEYNKMEEKYFA
jgi:hypothetical protein